MPIYTEAAQIKRSEVEPQGDVIWEVPTSHKVIALTFDDGPNPVFTPQILDILKENNVHATFFVVGDRMKEYPEIMERIALEGHQLGNHTMTHCYSNRASVDKMKEEISETRTYIEKWQPGSPLLFRPPGGYINEELLVLLKEEGYKAILWSWHQDTKDWAAPGVQAIANHVIKNAHNGDIVLLHDGLNNNFQTVRALKIILPTLQKEGYRFITVSELLQYRKQFRDPIKDGLFK